MNLFRSEEDVLNWEKFDPVSEQSIMPVANWAKVFSGPLFRNRLEPDIFAKRREYSIEFVKTLASLGKSGNFWVPDR